MSNKMFKNTATAQDIETPPETRHQNVVCSHYGFDEVPRLLHPWSRAFQIIVSQAGTKLITDKFHDTEPGIYKAEGGCNIVAVGELVLYNDSCCWSYGKHDKNSVKMARLITAIILNWDPMNPLDSMLNAAASHLAENGVETTLDEIKEAGLKSHTGPFGGDALSSLFNHNPYGKWDGDRDYLRYCYEKIEGMTTADVDQKFEDEDSADSLLKQMKENSVPGEYIYCCTARRRVESENGNTENPLSFWVNGSKFYGWFSMPQLEEFIETGVAPSKEKA